MKYKDDFGEYVLPTADLLPGVKISDVPFYVRNWDQGGVYLVKSQAFDSDVLYVGQSHNFSSRLWNLLTHSTIQEIARNYDQAEVVFMLYPTSMPSQIDEVCQQDGVEAVDRLIGDMRRDFESACIEHYQPVYNKQRPVLKNIERML